MKRSLVIIGAIVAIGLAGFTAYSVAGVVIRSDGNSTHSRDRIKSLTVTEHARLEASLKSFRSLPRQDQDRLREIHDVLQGPESDSQLRQIAHNYYSWYKSLGPSDRADLRDEQDARKKLALVEQFQRQEEEHPRRTGNESWRRGAARRALSSEDLAAVMQVVEEKIRDTESLNNQLPDLGETEGIRRYYPLVKLLSRQFVNRHGRGPESQRLLRGFFRDDKLFDAISDKAIREHLDREDHPRQGGRPTPRRSMRWMHLIIESLIAEYKREIEGVRPSSEELLGFFTTLDRDAQDSLMGLSHKKFMRALENRFLKADPQRYPPNPRELIPRSFRERRGGRRPPDHRGDPRDERRRPRKPGR